MNLVLCDDERLFVEALAAVFRAAGHIVTECVSVDDLDSAVEAASAEVCMVDLFFGSEPGLDAIQRVTSRFPHTHVVVYTGCRDAEMLRRVRRCGVAGVLPKSLDLSAVVLAVETEARRPVSRASTGRPRIRAREVAPERLTTREREVLVALCGGAGTASLARMLSISTFTARSHVQNVLRKLGAHSRLEAVAIAVSMRLLTASELTDPLQALVGGIQGS